MMIWILLNGSSRFEYSVSHMDDFYDAFLGCNDTKKFKGIHHFFGNRPILQLPQIFELPTIFESIQVIFWRQFLVSLTSIVYFFLLWKSMIGKTETRPRLLGAKTKTEGGQDRVKTKTSAPHYMTQ